MNQIRTYPELYYSTQISTILSSEPDLPKALEVPIEPPKPIKPKNYDDGGNKGCSVMMVIFGIVLFVTAISAEEVKVEFVLSSIAIIVLSFFLVYMNSSDKEEAEKKMIEYKQATEEYPDKLKEFEEKKKNYHIKKILYDGTVKRLKSPSNLQAFRKRKIEKYLSSRATPTFENCDASDIVKKGASEDYFVSVLKQSTEWEIYVNKRIPVGNKFYYPDIIVVISNVYIIVEIDEPYSGNDGSPIHYLHKPNGVSLESIDSKRNEFMTKNGWEVVRFSEEQIFLHTEDCLVYLYYLAENIENGIKGVDVDDDFKKEKWTKEQSHKMAYKRFRRTYVPQQYQCNIDNEDYRNYEDIKVEIFSESTVSHSIISDDDLPS